MKCYSFAFLCFLGSTLSRRLWCKAGMESLEWAVVVLSLTHHQNMFCLIGPRSHLINVNWTLFLSTTAMATTTNMARIPCFWGIAMNVEIVIMKLSFNIYWYMFYILVHYFPPPTLIHTWPRSPPLRVLTTSGERHDLRNTFFPSQFPFWEKTILWPLTGNGLPDPEKILDFPSRLSLWCLRIPTLKHHHW